MKPPSAKGSERQLYLWLCMADFEALSDELAAPILSQWAKAINPANLSQQTLEQNTENLKTPAYEKARESALHSI